MRQLFLKTLHGLLGEDPGVAVVHSSLADLAPPPGFSKWDILYGLFSLIDDGWTVALPAFTFSFCDGRPFHHQKSRSEVGLLADWLLACHPDASRTHHPIYSFVVAGPAAIRFHECASSTTFGDDSPFGLFERENAVLVMLGCTWRNATQFHRYEEKAGVPYRYFKQFAGRANMGDGNGERDVSTSMYVRELAVNPVNDFAPAVSRLRSEGLIRSAALWRGRVEAARVADMARICTEMLGTNPLAFVANAAAVAHGLAKIRQAREEPVLRVAVLGSSNVHLLRSALESDLASCLPERRVETFEVPYGQLHQALLDPDSELRCWRPHVSIFCDRLEDLLGRARLDEVAIVKASEAVEQYASSVSAYATANQGWTFVHRFASHYRCVHEGDSRHLATLVDQMNSLLIHRLAGLDRVLWVDVAAEAASNGAPSVDFRLWHLARMPYSEPLSRRLARCWTGKLLAIFGKTARVVVLDLDNTLWGGVLGEEGVAGVRLGGDFPGNAFLSFQRVLRTLAERGIVLAICSKNDEDLAIDAINGLPEMQFRLADIAAYRINWREKWLNVLDIAAELNLGLESFLFVDDDPVEREAIRRNLPGARVLDLPDDPTAYVETLLASPWISMAEVTPEDRKRTETYNIRRQLEQQRRHAASLDDFYASLGAKLHLRPLAEGNVARAVQLCMKTNQFNTTTRRYDQRGLQQILAEGGDVVVLGFEDRYSDLENVGLIILRPSPVSNQQGVVDSYLLSCRVLGRGLEVAVLHWAIRRARSRQWTALRGVVVDTERNTPVRTVFQRAGFRESEIAGEWVASTAMPPALPAWLTVMDSYVGDHDAGSGSQAWL